MKKRRFIILTLLLLISLVLVTACGEEKAAEKAPEEVVVEEKEEVKEEVEEKAPQASEEEEEEEEPVDEGIGSIEEEVLVDDQGIKITLNKFFLEYDYYTFNFLIENDSEKDLTFTIEDLSVNGLMEYGSFYEDVPSGKKANSQLSLSVEGLEYFSGVEKLQELEFIFEINETDNYDEILETEPLVIKILGNEDYEQSYDFAGEAVYDEDGLRFSIGSFYEEDGDFYVRVFLENDTDLTMAIQFDKTSVNGFMMDPMAHIEARPGKKAYDYIKFYSDDLKENDIDDIEELEFDLDIFDAKTYDTLDILEGVKINY